MFNFILLYPIKIENIYWIILDTKKNINGDPKINLDMFNAKNYSKKNILAPPKNPFPHIADYRHAYSSE